MRVLKTLLVACVACLSLPVTDAGAYYQTGNDLLEWCNAEPGTPQRVQCYAYIEGVIDSMSNGSAVLSYRACFRNGIVAKQMRDVTVAYLTAHANVRDVIAASLVAAAMAEAFPCHE
jgi:Rap1a immunity proteins